MQLDTELHGQRVLNGETVVPMSDLADAADKVTFVERHDLFALHDAGDGESISAQADVSGLRGLFAVGGQRDNGDDGTGGVGRVVADDDDGAQTVLHMAGDLRQVGEPELHVGRGFGVETES